MTLPVASVALRARASLCAMFVCELVVLSVSAVVGSSEPPKNEAKEIRLVSRSSLVRSALTRRRRRRSGRLPFQLQTRYEKNGLSMSACP